MPMLTMKSACKYMSVSRPILLNWAKQGDVRAFKVAGRWRFYQEDLDLAVRQGLSGLPHKPRVSGSTQTEKEAP